MSFNQSVLLPVSPDEAFALVTEPERIRRWLAVSAYIDLRAGGDFRWTVATGTTPRAPSARSNRDDASCSPSAGTRTRRSRRAPRR